MLALPMFHCTALYSLLPSSAYLGSTLAIAPRPDRTELLDLMESARVTTFLGPPTLFAMLAMGDDLGERDTSSLRLIAYAGSPMHPDTIRRLRALAPHVALRNFFGLTETTSVTHVLPAGDALSHAESVGKPLPEVRAIIADAAGQELPPGATGELCIHRANVIPGYWGQPDRLEESFRGDWFRTGDRAHMDEDGYLYVHGREKDVIIVGGENVIAGRSRGHRHGGRPRGGGGGSGRRASAPTSGNWSRRWWCRRRAPAHRARRQAGVHGTPGELSGSAGD